MVTEFVLKNTLARVMGLKVPPYWLFDESAVRDVTFEGSTHKVSATTGDALSYDAIDMMGEQQLAEAIRSNALGVPMTFPLEIKEDGGQWWLLPYEPLISITGKNTIAKRTVSKGRVRGTVKERWSQDDYALDIDGVLMSQGGYPSADVARLRRMCEAGRLQARCPLLEIFSISQIVVESWSFPFTSGPQNQAYRISASSDDIFKLLLTKQDLIQQ